MSLSKQSLAFQVLMKEFHGNFNHVIIAGEFLLTCDLGFDFASDFLEYVLGLAGHGFDWNKSFGS